MNSADNSLDAWNQAHHRLVCYLDSFALGDRAQVSRLTLRLFEQAQELHRGEPSANPTTLTMRHAQKVLAEWFSAHLDHPGQTPSQLLASGYIALLLSRLAQNAPTAFLDSTVPPELEESMRHTLMITGPDLNISSMTPRHLDYGPMLEFARQTWHRWDTRAFFTAVLFWTGVYSIFYWWLSEVL